MATSADEATKEEIFAGEVFDFFSSNANTWLQNLASLHSYNLLLGRKKPLFLNLKVKKGIVTLAYIFRFECRKKFRIISDNLKTSEYYETCVRRCGISFFQHPLAWIAFLLELTTYCYLEGYDYSETGRQCLVEYSKDLLCSETRWTHFNDTVGYIYMYYDPLITSFSGKLNESDIMASFLKVFDDIIKYDKFNINKRYMIYYRNEKSHSVSDNFPDKLRYLPTYYDLDRIRFGYLVKRKNESTGKLREKQKVGSPNSKNPRSRKMKIKSRGKSEDDIMFNISSHIKNLTISGDSASVYLGDKTGHKAKYLSTVASSGSGLHLNKTQSKVNELKDSAAKSDEIKRGIVITGTYLEKIQNEMMNEREQNCKIDIKVYSPSKQIANVIEKLGEDFIDTIDKENISASLEGVYAVDPPDWEDNKLIVLNSADEEDDEGDEEDESCRLSLISQLSLIHKDWNRTELGPLLVLRGHVHCRSWKAEIPEPLLNNETLNEMFSAAYSEALVRTSNAGDDLSSEQNVEDLPKLNRRKVTIGKKREWRKNTVSRH